jgi:CRISP-associated protein Cas1
MEFRNIVISNPARLSIKHNQLCIMQEREALIPLEDICSVLLESRQIQISAAALERLAVSGITVFFCDEKHLPSAQLVAMNQFSRQHKILYAQFELPRPIQKQLWKCIVQQKINNQAACLRMSGKAGFEELEKMVQAVRSGDVTNVEAQAAACYFPKLFGQRFTRNDLCLQNAALNYGYAILRGAIARNLVMHGLEPCIGLQHHNQLNSYNLADDLIEPFRPLIDLYVSSLPDTDGDELTPAIKRKLFNATNLLMLQNGKKMRVMYAIGRSAASLAKSIVNQENALELPTLIGLEEGRYE